MPYNDPEKARAAKAASYQRNKERYRTTNARVRRKPWLAAKEAREVPCTDCGIQYPYYVMQFDHIGTDKIADVNKLVRAASLQRVLDEIAKCEVVCANCHAERTFQRL